MSEKTYDGKSALGAGETGETGQGLSTVQRDPPGLAHQRIDLKPYRDEGGPNLNSEFDDNGRQELDRHADEEGLPRDESSTAKD